MTIMMYVSWNTEHDRQNFFHFGQFALLPSNNPKNQNFEKKKKTPSDIIILHMCTINDSHMMYAGLPQQKKWISL